MTSTQYVHTVLEDANRQIRLLKLLPSGNRDDLVRVTISTYTFPVQDDTRLSRLRTGFQLPSYFALSYVCGTGDELKKTQYILVDSSPFPVTERVHTALLICRNSANIAMYLWVDCICISQTDNAEKSQQVKLLHRIYNRATLTLVWLSIPILDLEKCLRFAALLLYGPSYLQLLDKFQRGDGMKSDLEGQSVWQMGSIGIVRDQVMRAGYSTALSSFMAAAQAGKMVKDFSLKIPSPDEPSFETSIRYPHQFVMEGSYLGQFRQAQAKRIQTEIQKYHLSHKTGQTQGQNLQTTGTTPTQAFGSFRGQVEYAFKHGRLNRKQLGSFQNNIHDVIQSSYHGGPIKKGLNLNDYEDIRLRNPIVAPLQSELVPATTWTPNKQTIESMTKEELIENAHYFGECLLAGSKYFERMWTLQEPCVGRTAAIIGESMYLPFVNFLQIVTFLRETLKIDVPMAEEIHKLQWINNEWQMGARLPLRILLFECRDRQCSDPRDKIYALLGLTCERQTILVQPDYNLPTPIVYANATRFIIASDRSLDIICAHEGREIINGLPSWSPDFRCFGQSNLRIPLADLSGRNNIYHASLSDPPGMMETPYILPTNWQELRVKGVYLGSICKLSGETLETASLTEMEARWSMAFLACRYVDDTESKLCNALSQLINLYDQNYHASALGAVQHHWLETMRDLTGFLQQRPHELVRRYLTTLHCGRTSLDARCDFDGMLTLMSRACIGDEGGTAAIETIWKSLESGMRGRKLFTLEGQDMIGACPNTATLGDMVCILTGCSVPVVLRRLQNSEQYSLVGECYCYGFMDGEALMLMEQGVLNAYEFVLR